MKPLQRTSILFGFLLIISLSCSVDEKEASINEKTESNKNIRLDLSKVDEYHYATSLVGDLNTGKVEPLKSGSKISFKRNSTKRLKPRLLDSFQLTTSIQYVQNELDYEWKPLEVTFPEPVKAYPPVFRDESTLNIKYLDQDQGLTSSYAIALHYDSRGWLWVGSFKAGFSMYNGNVFYHFTKEQGFADDDVIAIEEDRDGNIYIAMTKGVVLKYDGLKFYSLQFADLSLSTANALEVSKNGDLWVSTSDQGIFRVSENGSSQTSFADSQSQPDFSSMAICSDGNVWIGSFDQGLFYLKDGILYNFREAGDVQFSGIWDLYEDQEAHLWIATDEDGLIIKDEASFWQYNSTNGLPSDNYLSIFQDSRQRMWLGSYGGGVTRMERNQLIHFSASEGLSMPYIWEIEEDDQGNIWLGTDGGGISKIEGEYFYNLTDNNGLPNSYVFGIDQDSDGDLWFATFGGGIARKTKNVFTHYNSGSGFPSDLNNSLIIDHMDRVWVATVHEGLILIDDDTWQYVLPDLLGELSATAMFYSPLSDLVWIGTDGDGLFVVKNESLHQINLPDELSDISVKSFSENSYGDIHIATSNNGFLKISEKRIWNYTLDTGLPSNSIYVTYVDGEDDLWLGFGGEGLYRVQDNELRPYQGLSNGFIWSITQSSDERLWVGTEKGLNVIDSSGLAISYRKSDGLDSDGFFLNSSFRDRNGILWFGSDKSLVIVDEDDLPKSANSDLLTAEIHQVNINDEFVDYQTNEEFVFNNVRPYTNVPNDLELHHSNNHLTIHFSALNPKSQHNVMYRYRILGMEDEWSNPTTNPFVDLRNLPDGNFMFEVAAKEGEGEWSSPDTLTFYVAPPIWKTPLAYMLYVLMATLAFFLYVKLRFKQFHHRQRWLESKVKQATTQLERTNQQLASSNDDLKSKKRELEAALNELKTTQKQLIQSEKMSSLGTLSSGIAHEINNSLNFIQGGIFGLNQYLNDNNHSIDGEVKELLRTTDEGLDRASKIVKSLSYFNRSPETNHHVCNINELLTDCIWMLHNKIKHRVEIVNQISEKPVYVLGNSSKLYQAFLNVVSNAEEAIPDEGVIVIRSQIVNENAIITISDNGIGIPDEISENITDPFFTTKGRDKSTGLGLTLTYNFVTEYKGTLAFDSSIGKGTKVTIQLPAYDAVIVEDIDSIRASY